MPHQAVQAVRYVKDQAGSLLPAHKKSRYTRFTTSSQDWGPVKCWRQYRAHNSRNAMFAFSIGHRGRADLEVAVTQREA